MTDFKTKYGPWAIVTGASSGIGKAIATHLAAKGMNLVLVARRADALKALSATLVDSNGIETLTETVDLADREQLARLLDRTTDLDVGLLVAAAGFGASGPAAFADPAREAEMIDVNITAVVTMSQHYAQRFSIQRRGGIVLFGSLLGRQGVPGAANYSATKAYIHAYGEALASELDRRNVHVLVSSPGPVATEFAQRAELAYSFSTTPEAVARKTLGALGRKRYIAPAFMNRFLQSVFSITPRSMRVGLTREIMASMSKKAKA